MDQNLRNRLTFGPLLLAGLLGVLWLDWWIEQRFDLKGAGLLGLLIVVVPLANWELARLFAAEHVQPYRMISGIFGSVIVLHAFATQFQTFQPIAASALALIIAAVPLTAALRKAAGRTTEDAIVKMAGTLLATMYLGGLAWFLMALRVKEGQWEPRFEGTTMHVVMILLCVKFTDIGAFFTGKTLGRHKLIFWLSPGKTWEGLIGGVIMAAIVGAACARFLTYLEWWKGAIFGAVIGAVGQAGDLLESLMKRDAQVKDSGSMLPGFGGVLDVIDSPLVAAPVAYLLFGLL
jgi:phosphatidate cytidylyltransferase